jgi:predicted Zn-dependent protease
VNGDAATVAQFSATTSDNQVLRGEVLFVQHGGTVYQFLGLSVATAWPTLGPAISQSLRSFGPTPINQQFRQRTYLRVVTLPRATSVADLAGQSGGAVTLTTLATINAVAENATLPAGSKVKTVGYR